MELSSKDGGKRQKRSVIGRIATANLREGERYYLKLLLNHVRGPFSFEDLLMVNERDCQTFKEAVKERGLLESDNSISECLREAVLFKMPSALRNLFATILVHCDPTDIRKLWDTYCEDMSEDFRRIHKYLSDTQLQCTLKSINYFLQSMGKSAGKYDLPKLNQCRDENVPTECREIIEEKAIQVSEEDFNAQSKLNPEQEQAFKIILQRVDFGRAGLFFVDGPGGTGKTFLYRALLANVRSRSMIALATTTSGVAATILPGGRTVHSRFDIPLETSEIIITNMSKQSGGAKLIRKAKLILWDEEPMAMRQTIKTVDRSFGDIMDVDEPFGGKIMIFGGDFRQVLPVVPKSTRVETVNASLVRSYLWPKMEKDLTNKKYESKDRSSIQ
ncbi:ATP-dependent DNA helicase RRM3-like [Nicotiana tabacum]|uniref:ATP-dependent DNA helicase RRM3-like n=1 Tax=Nicotiana tabacum TaxID=4097 RepID=A0AC58S389_TOBAC